MQNNNLQNLLGKEDGAGKIMAHLQKLSRLAAIYQSLAPPYLQSVSRVANYNFGTIIIHANNNAIASKLQHLVPSLTEGFLRKGIDCNGIKIKVAAPLPNAFVGNKTPKIISQTSFAELQNLQKRLADSPLKESLASLLARVSTPTN